jgi:glycosyltransferase involved in cell wall biosynthesis
MRVDLMRTDTGFVLTGKEQVSVIIPTLAEQHRFEGLRRCIASIRDSSTSRCVIIAVVNGSRWSEEVVQWLSKQDDVRLIIEPTPSLPNAVRIGREAVETPFFSTLDDDDEYLPGSTDLKLSALKSHPEADLIVTNGLNNWNGRDERFYTHLSSVSADPLGTLFEANWLHNCNALYRSERIPSMYFRDAHPFAEWTWLAYRLALDGKRILTLDEPCFRYNCTPGSLSQSQAYRAAYPPLFQRMLDCNPPARIRKLIQRRLSAALHDRSAACLASGNYHEALQAHVQSLILPGGLRYLSYTRRLLPGWPKA